MLHKRMKKGLASFLCMVLAVTCAIGNIPVTAIAASESATNWGLGKSYETNVPAFHGDKNDNNGTKLTDGVLCAGYDEKLVGFTKLSNGAATFTIDLEQERNVSQVIVSGYDINDYGIRNPIHYKVEYMNAANWTVAYDQAQGRSHSGLAGDAEGTYQLTANANFRTQKVRISLTHDTEAAWIMIDEIQILGAGDVNAPVAPTISANLSATKSVLTGAETVFEIQAAASDGGALSYQWFKDEKALTGEKTNRYVIAHAKEADSGRYKVVVTNTKNELSESTTSAVCALSVKSDTATNILQNIPFTTSMHVGDPNAGNEALPGGSEGNYIDYDEEHPSAVQLTNGIKEKEDIMSVNVGRYNKNYNALLYADFMFDLGSVQPFSQLNISTLAGKNGILGPKRLQIMTSNDSGTNKKWETIFDGPLDDQQQVKEYIIATENNEQVSAQFVKLHVFFGNGTWIAIDEIELFDRTTGDIPDGIIGTIGGDEPEDQSNNLALHKVYTSSGKTTVDPDKTLLTDGKTGTTGGNDWVKYMRSTGESGEDPYKETEIVVDLGSDVSFEQIETNFLHDAYGGIIYPEWIKVEHSSDNANWTKFEEVPIPAVSSETPLIYNYQYVASSSVSARYVKVTFPSKHWVFVDEIKVLKAKTEIDSGEVEPELMDPNNIAIGCDYTPAWPANDGYVDLTKKLTDGKRGVNNFGAKEWVGFHQNDGTKLGQDEFYVTVDLGAVKNFEQIKVGSLKAGTVGIPHPLSMKIAISSDQSNWTVLTDQKLSYPNTDGIQRFCYSTGSVSARYVRVYVDIDSSWLFLDDIEILAKNDARPDANIEPDNGWEYNIIRDYSYSISRTPDMNNRPGLLTDGKYGTAGTKYDKNWMGFKKNRDAVKNHVAMTFDLYAANSISQVILQSKSDAKNNLSLPKNLRLSVSHDNTNWYSVKKFDNSTAPSASAVKMVWDGKIDSFKAVQEGATMVYARYVRLEFDVPADETYAYVDEVKIIGKRGKCSNASSVLQTNDSGAYNVAAGKSYKVVPKGENYAYSDLTNTKLTDGILGSQSFSDFAWVGFKQFDSVINNDNATRWPNKTIIIDLGSTKTVESIVYNILSESSAGLGQPWASRSFASMDGEHWVSLSRSSEGGGPWMPDGIHTYGFRNQNQNAVPNHDLSGGLEKIAARYIRVDLEMFGWNFIDEITVMGYDGQQEDAVLADYGRKLENGRNYKKVDESTSGVQDMVLVYNGWYGIDKESSKPVGDITTDQYRPLLTYVDRQNEATDTMFDSVLLLGLTSRYGRSFYSPDDPENAQEEDWKWYLDKTFAENGDVDNLNKAAQMAAQELKDPNYKVNLVVMFPTTNPQVKNFGTLDSGRSLDMNKEEDWKYATDWWTNQVLTRFAAGNYEHIELKGLYWLNEQADYTSRIQYWTNSMHELDLKAYWIPFFHSSGYLWSEDLGFDATAYQANHFFDNAYENGGMGKLGNDQMKNHAARMNYGGMGAELEVDDRAYQEVGKYNQWLDYLNAAVEYEYDGPGIYRNWYYGSPLSKCAYSGNAIVRSIYEYAYQVMRGTYTPKEYIAAEQFPGNPDIGGIVNGVTGGETSENTGGATSGGGLIKPDKPSSGKFAWEKINGVWKLKGADGKYITGWKKIDGLWFYMNADAVMQKGWQKVGNSWYYLKDSGAMAIGWQKIGNQWYYLKGNGAMATGWQWIDGKCYYLNASGQMAVNTTIGGYKVGANGAWIY